MNNLNQSIQVLQSFNIPVNYSSTSIQSIQKRVDMNSKSESEYIDMMKTILGVEEVSVNDGKCGFLYTVQELIERNNSLDQNQDIVDIVDVISDNVDKYLKKYGYSVEEVVEGKKVTVKKKVSKKSDKISKRMLCEVVYKEHFGKKTRKEIIGMFVDNCDCTIAGGSTYYANFGPNGSWKCDIHNS